MIQIFAGQKRILPAYSSEQLMKFSKNSVEIDDWKSFSSTSCDEFSCPTPTGLIKNVYKSIKKKLNALQHNHFSIPKLPSGMNYKVSIIRETLAVVERNNPTTLPVLQDDHEELHDWLKAENEKFKKRFENKLFKVVQRKVTATIGELTKELLSRNVNVKDLNGLKDFFKTKLESEVIEIVEKRGRVQYKLFRTDYYDEKVVSELTKEALSKADINSRIQKLTENSELASLFEVL